MSYDHPAIDAEKSVDDEDSRVDARCAFVVLAATVLGFLLFVSSFDGSLGVPGVL